MTFEEAIDRLDDLAEKYNQRRARYWASAEEHRERGAQANAKVDRRHMFEVAYTQEMLATEAKSAMSDIANLTAEMRGLL